MTRRVVGVLGGMGPEATIQLQQRLLKTVKAKDDADHLPLLIDMNPQVPSRIAHLIEKRGESPGPALAEMARRLKDAGATALAMPCNTAHHYATYITGSVPVPFLNMVALSVATARQTLSEGARVGILASPAVKMAGVFDAPLSDAGLLPLWPDDMDRMLSTIKLIKANGPTADAREILADASIELARKGADLLFVACSEYSLMTHDLVTDVPVIDTVDVLASAIHDHITKKKRADPMAITYLKKAAPRPAAENNDIRDIVSVMLANIEREGEDAVRRYAERLDGWTGDIVLSDESRAAACHRVPQDLKDDIQFAHTNIRRFAEAQKATMGECEIEVIPGLIAGQKQIPVFSAGCYVPGGRYSHIASALMTITTAKVAGVRHITAVSPTRPGTGIPDAIVYAMDLCGADLILNLGGVQGIAAMAQGLFGAQPADILVGPGNSYVAEAKRMLFGEVGIDMFAGPTDSLVIADHTAEVETVAWDLVSQAEHGADSPVWLVTTSKDLARGVMARADALIRQLPEPNQSAAHQAWADRAEVILCDSREEAIQVSDRYAPEHLQVQAMDLDWWLDNLSAYGSLFLGKETTVSFGDKTSGPNHVLPTSGAARYTGGLSVHKFTKTVTWQRSDAAASHELAMRTARISRVEGMEGHARAAELRLS